MREEEKECVALLQRGEVLKFVSASDFFQCSTLLHYHH